MAGPETKARRGAVHIELFNSNRARIQSNWPVTSSRGEASIGTKLLSKALVEGLEAQCDSHRTGFFEVEIGDAWFYFHVAHKLGRIYLVCCITPVPETKPFPAGGTLQYEFPP